MSFLPSPENLHLQCASNPAEVLAQVAQQLKEQQANKIEGEVAANSFRIRLQSNGSHPVLLNMQKLLAPQLRGTVHSTENGTKLEITIGMHQIVAISIQVAFIVLAVSSLSITGTHATPNTAFALFIVAMLILLLQLYSYAKSRDKSDRPVLVAFIKSCTEATSSL